MESSWMTEIKGGAKQVLSSTQALQLDSENLSWKDIDRGMNLQWDTARGMPPFCLKKKKRGIHVSGPDI